MKNEKFLKSIERPGVLNKVQIYELMELEIIKNGKPEHIGLSSFDLHLSNCGYKLKAGFKCREDRTFSEVISATKSANLGTEEIIFKNNKARLEVGTPYLFKLEEEISLPENFYGQGSGKSSIGRLDVLTRLLVDKEDKYCKSCSAALGHVCV